MNIQKTIAACALVVTTFTAPVSAFAATPTPTPQPSVMKEKTATNSSADAQEEVTETKAEYTLPYPGILPDHPLYFLKKLRDQIMERLIADPIRKMEFYMLQADKSINTGVFLAAKQNESLTAEAVLRGKAFVSQAIESASALKAEGKEVPPYLIERFGNALAKYQEVLGQLISTATETQKANLQATSDALGALQESAAKLK